MPVSNHYVKASKVEIILAGESVSHGVGGTGERRYIIKIPRDAFSKSMDINKNDYYLLWKVEGGSVFDFELTPSDVFFAAALAKSVCDTVGGNDNIFTTMPFSYLNRYSSQTYVNSIWSSYSLFNYVNLSVIGTPFSPLRTDLICTSINTSFSDNALLVSLQYSFIGFIPAGKYRTFIMPYSNAQRYPSVYGFESNGNVSLNTVEYSGDIQVAELPELYLPEYRYKASVLSPYYPAFYQGYVSTINNSPVNWLQVSDIVTPANYSMSMMIESYNVTPVMSITLYQRTSLPSTVTTCIVYPAPLYMHELNIVGYTPNILSADNGFSRPIIYVDPSTGKPPEDIEPGNGISTKLIGKPADWSVLAI